MYGSLILRFLLFALWALAPVFSPLAQAQSDTLVGHAAPVFDLSDQYNESLVMGNNGPPVALLFADRKVSEMCSEWAEGLSREPGVRLPLTTVAVLSGVPRLARGLVRRMFRGHDAALMDWGGSVAEQYGYGSATCRLVVVRSGTVVATGSEHTSGVRYAALVSALR